LGRRWQNEDGVKEMTRFLWKRRRNVQQGGLTENKNELVSGDAAFCNVDEARTRLTAHQGHGSVSVGRKSLVCFKVINFILVSVFCFLLKQ
jgi:hypothetical protein